VFSHYAGVGVARSLCPHGPLGQRDLDVGNVEQNGHGEAKARDAVDDETGDDLGEGEVDHEVIVEGEAAEEDHNDENVPGEANDVLLGLSDGHDEDLNLSMVGLVSLGLGILGERGAGRLNEENAAIRERDPEEEKADNQVDHHPAEDAVSRWRVSVDLVTGIDAEEDKADGSGDGGKDGKEDVPNTLGDLEVPEDVPALKVGDVWEELDKR